VMPGDRIAVMALNNASYLELYHAAFLGAAVINPLNLRLAGKELDYILRDSGTEVLFVDGWFAQLVADALAAAGERDPLRHTVLIGEGDVPHDIGYEELLASADPELPPEPEEDDPVVLMYTGGTTGLPKGVLNAQRGEMLNVYHVAMAYRFAAGEVSLMQTPMFHAASVAGILGTPVTGGKTVMVPSFSPEPVLDAIEAESVTQTVMVPTMIGMLFLHPSYRPERLASLRTLVYGASPMPAAILDQVLRDLPGVELFQGYGMTEAASVATMLGPADHLPGGPKLRSAGSPLIGVTLSIQDEEGQVLPADEVGEVCVRGGNLMIGYWNNPEATAEAFRGDWYHTGDAGFVDEDGYLFLVDRVKDMIVTGGENVYSVEVENAISTHPAVAQVAVIGIPHEVWVEQVHAVVVLRPGSSATSEDLVEHARASIAGYKLPKSVEFRTEPLPLSGAMKVLKRELRAPYWE
jgi:long-chain acyl-CoA synthetase